MSQAAALTNIRLTLEQTDHHRALHLVRIGYSYELTNMGGPTKDGEPPFVVVIHVIGDDLIHDDLLAGSVDTHWVDCGPGDTVTIERSLLVGQSLLDEDIGDDEIKLAISASRENSEVAKAMSPVVRGRF